MLITHVFDWETKKYQSLDKICELIIYEIVMIMSNIPGKYGRPTITVAGPQFF